MSVLHSLTCPVVFISTSDGKTRNIMTATAMFVSEKEPILAVSVETGHLTDQLISRTGEFTLIIASEKQKDFALQVAKVRGDTDDKFEKFGIPTIPEHPLIPKDSSAWMHCKVLHSREVSGYHVYIAQVTDEADSEYPPLVWRKDRFFALLPL